jgi:hypothetical protein
VGGSKVGKASDYKTGLKNLLKVGKSVLKLKATMWKGDYAKL